MSMSMRMRMIKMMRMMTTLYLAKPG